MHDTPPDPRSLLLRDRELLRQLSRPAPARLLMQTLLEWVYISMLAALAVWLSHLAASLACMLLIATRQNALLVLMHEYSHFQFSRRHPWLNDLLGDLLTAFPFFISVHGFRRNHLAHHRAPGTDADPNLQAALRKPQYQYPKPRKHVLLEIARHAAGWYTLNELKRYTLDAGMATALPLRVHAARAAFAIAVLAGVWAFDLWREVLLYWLLPMATFFMAILYLRDLGEHFGMPGPGFYASRTVLAGPLERLLICQNGVNFHAEHHLFPSVPFLRLRRLHDLLMEDSHYRRHAVITHGYLHGLLAELSREPEGGAPAK